MGFLRVVRFPPSSQKQAERWLGYSKITPRFVPLRIVPWNGLASHPGWILPPCARRSRVLPSGSTATPTRIKQKKKSIKLLIIFKNKHLLLILPTSLVHSKSKSVLLIKFFFLWPKIKINLKKRVLSIVHTFAVCVGPVQKFSRWLFCGTKQIYSTRAFVSR